MGKAFEGDAASGSPADAMILAPNGLVPVLLLNLQVQASMRSNAGMDIPTVRNGPIWRGMKSGKSLTEGNIGKRRAHAAFSFEEEGTDTCLLSASGWARFFSGHRPQ